MDEAGNGLVVDVDSSDGAALLVLESSESSPLVDDSRGADAPRSRPAHEYQSFQCPGDPVLMHMARPVRQDRRGIAAPR